MRRRRESAKKRLFNRSKRARKRDAVCRSYTRMAEQNQGSTRKRTGRDTAIDIDLSVGYLSRR